MKYVLVTVSRGIIDEVTFYNDQLTAIRELSAYVKAMDPEHHDAAVFGPEAMIANAKAFLDENDRYVERRVEDVAKSDIKDESIFIIGNPVHRLGFMVASSDDPLGYNTSVPGLSDLGQMRKDFGSHLKLYRVEPVTGPLAAKADLEKYNAECFVEDFDYSLIEEYLK